MSRFDEREKRILEHIEKGEFAYPKLTENEKHSIRVIADHYIIILQQKLKIPCLYTGRLPRHL